MPDFVHLHVHSRYSIRDGMIDIKSLVGKVKSSGMKALALTDHCILSGAVELQQEANRAGIKPIYGCEILVGRCSRLDKDGDGYGPHHLVLLAENQEGWENLIRLSSAPLLNGYFDSPKVDKEMLREHSAGLIALSACREGEVASTLTDEGEDRAAEAIEEFRSIFHGRPLLHRDSGEWGEGSIRTQR